MRRQCGHVLFDARDEAFDARQGWIDRDRAGGFERGDDGPSHVLGRCEWTIDLDEILDPMLMSAHDILSTSVLDESHSY